MVCSIRDCVSRLNSHQQTHIELRLSVSEKKKWCYVMETLLCCKLSHSLPLIGKLDIFPLLLLFLAHLTDSQALNSHIFSHTFFCQTVNDEVRH